MPRTLVPARTPSSTRARARAHPLSPRPLTPAPAFAVAAAIAIGAALLLSVAAQAAPALATWTTDHAEISIDDRGSIASIRTRAAGSDRPAREFLAPGQPAPLLQVRLGTNWHQPNRAEWNPARQTVSLHYPVPNVTVQLQISRSSNHVTLAVTQLQPAGEVAAVLWGPYPLSLGRQPGEVIGEVVGVVRDETGAVGLQALNPKTLGGYPETEEGSTDRPYAARAMPFGSQLQAYSLDRSRPRVLDVWGRRAPRMPVEAIPGETAVGSRIALFACPTADALATIGRLELIEGLPHPLINGTWAKVSQERGRPYLIADYSEADIDELLGYTQRGNLASLYHGNAFQSWGHYRPSPKFFPGGVAGVRACVEKARAKGIRLGAHTLSNFIQTHDPYITPVPDPRLVLTGSSPLAADIDAATTTIPVTSPEYFAQKDRNELHTVRLGQELIRYRAVSAAAPWQLLDCQRGAFGTRPAAHAAGLPVGKLMDHSYKVFFPNLELQREIARNLAQTFNETGWSHLDFDGHEGCLASGHGTYGNERFAQDFYDAVGHTVINGTSPPLSHYYWHFNTYCNWGEPWYGGFRDSMQEYRINNQAFCERNYLPKMLGWYLLTPATCLSDMEWMLARAAGYDAGFALATSLASLRRNPETGPILDAIREWDLARRSNAFPATLREALRQPKREFHLERIADTGQPPAWNLFAFTDSPDFTHEAVTRQPGEPTAAQWDVPNPHAAQPVQFKLRVTAPPDLPKGAKAGAFSNPVIEFNRSASLRIPIEIQPGQSLLVEKDGIARLYDAKGNAVRSVPLPGPLPRFQPGPNQVQFDGEFAAEPAPKVTVTFKTIGPPQRLTAR